MVTVEQLYKDFGVLADAKDKAGEHEDAYLSILSGVKGGASERRLACQFITRFFKYFPQLAEQAMEAHIDLCEDQDPAIRKQAIKELPAFSKDQPQHVGKIADILTQLLQSSDAAELSMVQASLLAVFKMEPKVTLNEIFQKILNDDDNLREPAVKFLSAKLNNIPEEILTKEIEDILVEKSKLVLQDVTGDEFVAFMKILSGLASMSTMQGRQQLLEIVTEQAELDQDFEAADPDAVDKLAQCIRQAMPFFSKNVHSDKFIVFMCDQVLPVMSKITNPEEPEGEAKEGEVKEGEIKEGEVKEGAVKEGAVKEGATVDIQLEILKLFAEMSVFCGDLENAEERIGKVFDRLLEYMPLPPSEEDGENDKPNEPPKLQFSYVECLMFAFHQLARRCPQFFTDEDQADRLKDFRVRLQFFARGVQVYIKQLRMALQGKTGDALKTEENKFKVVALKITNNINTLIKDLFHNPPSYKAVITLSWRPIGQKAAASTSPGQKRPGITPITYESDGAKKANKGGDKSDRRLYQPPTGKYSESAGSYPAGRGRGRGYSSGFGRGRGRGWRGNRW